ncbi:MAG: quinoprotein relay system zinc metallohydrolase 2 [Proteobacteria bacterium]|nr:quinoprotein relay system zinc metallohydrolase 2 [Pseudomonadota bacterium]
MSPATLCLLALLMLISAPCTRADDSFLTAIAPGVYMHRGQIADIDDAARGDSANLGVVVGVRCVAVIDTGGSLATGRALRAAIEQLTDKPICHVINTHVHFDHVLGNAAFAKGGAEFVGAARLADNLEASRDFFIENFSAELDGRHDAAALVTPSRLVAEPTRLDLGERTLLLTAVARAHTETDLTVLDEKTGTLFSGDLVFRERLPVLDGSVKGWLAWLKAASGLSYARVVPGHGPLDEHWPQGALAEQTYLDALLVETRAAIARGEFIEDAKHSVATRELAHWQLTARAHPLNVSRAFRELEWE